MKITQKITASLVTKLAVRGAAEHAVGFSDETAHKALLEHWIRAPTTAQRVVTRSRIVLGTLNGMSVDAIAEDVDVSPTTVRLWSTRFQEGGPEALLHDAPGRGRHAAIAPEAMQDRLREAQLVRADGLPVSIRRAARFLGVSTSAVWRAIRKTRHSA
jgi:transposase